MDIPEAFYKLWEYLSGMKRGEDGLCAYISRVERKKERRKKIFFWSFIIADILIGVWIGIFSFNKSTRIIEGEITPREKLIREEGFVTDWKYVYNIGTKYNKSEHYFMIELDFEKTYKVKTYALDAFDRKKFEKFGTGSYVTLLLDEQKGYGENREVQIAEVRSEDISSHTCMVANIFYNMGMVEKEKER